MKSREQIIQKLNELYDDMQRSKAEAVIADAYSDEKMFTDMASEAYAKMTILEWVLRDEED